MKGRNSLDVFDFGALFQALAQSQKLGTLRVTNGKREKFVYLNQGRVEGIYTRRSRFRIGRILYNLRAVEMDDLHRVLSEQKAGRATGPLGMELLSRDLIAKEELSAAVFYQVVEEMLELFYWRDISYEFFSGPAEKALPKISKELIRVGGSHDAGEVLLHVTKVIDDIDRFTRVTPSLGDVYEVVGDVTAFVESSDAPELARELLALVDGQRDMREILASIRWNRFDVLHLFSRLRTAEVIRPLDGKELLRLAESDDESLPPRKLARLFERVRELGVEGARTYLRLAHIYERLENRHEAVVCYVEYARRSSQEGNATGAELGSARAVEIFPESQRLRRFRVEILLEHGDEEGAASELVELANLERQAGDHADAAATLERALAWRPGDEDLILGRIAALEASGRLRLAGNACVDLARSREDADEPDAVEEALRLAVQIDGRSWHLRRLLIRHLADRGKSGPAVEEIGALVPRVLGKTARCPDRALGPLRLLRRWVGELGGGNSTAMVALADAFLARSARSDGLDVLLEAGEAQLTARRITNARDTFSKAVEISPDDAELREILAGIHIRLGERDMALSQLRRIARKYVKEGKIAAAERAYREMLEVDPFLPEALAELSRLSVEPGKEQQAARMLAMTGLLHRIAGRSASSVECFDRACRLDPENPDHVRLLAEALAEELGGSSSADSYRRLIAIHQERGEHAAAIDAGLKLLGASEEDDGDLRAMLKRSYEALGASLG